jgi:hypothetical protein
VNKKKKKKQQQNKPLLLEDQCVSWLIVNWTVWIWFRRHDAWEHRRC